MIKRKDLVDVADKDYQARVGEYVLCLNCGGEFGATRGDFFMIHMDTILKCCDCDSEHLALVKNEVKVVILKR